MAYFSFSRVYEGEGITDRIDISFETAGDNTMTQYEVDSTIALALVTIDKFIPCSAGETVEESE